VEADTTTVMVQPGKAEVLEWSGRHSTIKLNGGFFIRSPEGADRPSGDENNTHKTISHQGTSIDSTIISVCPENSGQDRLDVSVKSTNGGKMEENKSNTQEPKAQPKGPSKREKTITTVLAIVFVIAVIIIALIQKSKGAF
jgi:hypothetical protein